MNTYSYGKHILRFLKDKTLIWILRLAAAIAGAVTLLIFVFILNEALPIVVKIGIARFFTDSEWAPTVGHYFMTPMVVGTILATIGALIIAIPLGMLSGIFTFFFAEPKVAMAYRRIVELLAGIPSVVYGFWGLVVLVPRINSLHPPGASLLACVLILAIMILPTLALSVDASFLAVPQTTIDAARALGFGPWGILRTAMIPSSKSGLISAIILQTGRAIGETMAVLMVCGNVVQFPKSLFDPIRTLTANMALEMAYAMNDHRAALFVSGLILMIAVLILVLLAEAATRDF
jgi:phosphate transport system permease protein